MNGPGSTWRRCASRIYGSRLHSRYERRRNLLEGIPPGGRPPDRRGRAGRGTRGSVLRHLHPPRVHARSDPGSQRKVPARPALQHQRVALSAAHPYGARLPPLRRRHSLVRGRRPEAGTGDLPRRPAQALPPAGKKCVFIDDIANYAEGAAVVGIRGIQYTGHAELVRELSSLGVISS